MKPRRMTKTTLPSRTGQWAIFALFAVMALAVFLRFTALGKLPPSPDWDEAALGYNAYSILKTGRDEYGTFLPRELRSFDDYKPPLYMYLTVPSVAVFGLNVWAVRLPSAVMGSIAVLAAYVFIKKLYDDEEARVKRKTRVSPIAQGTLTALVAAGLLAISPWHLQFSRIAFEANVGVALNIIGLALFFYGLTSTWALSASAFIFGLSLYAYHSERVFVPLLVLTLAVLWRKELLARRKSVIIAVVVGFLTVSPLIPVVTDATAMTRLRGTSPLSDQTALLSRSVTKLETDKVRGDVAGQLLDNRRIVYAKTLIDGYISHFSFKWLFLTGDSNRHHAPDTGILYLWELPFVLLGFVMIWKRHDRISKFLYTWLFIAPLAASPTGGTPHAIRTLVFLPLFQICTATGLITALSWMSRMRKHTSMFIRTATAAGALVTGTAMMFFTVLYFHMYYNHMNTEYSQDWQYGYKQAVEYAETHKDDYTQIVVSPLLEQPHMFFLFYTKYDPVKYLAQGGTASGGFAENRNHFDKYLFRPIGEWGREKRDGSVLYIGKPEEIPNSPIHSIYYLNGKEAIRMGK